MVGQETTPVVRLLSPPLFFSTLEVTPADFPQVSVL